MSSTLYYIYLFSSWAGNTPTFTSASKYQLVIVKTKEAFSQTYFFDAYSVSSFCINSIDKYCIIQSNLKLASPFRKKASYITQAKSHDGEHYINALGGNYD